jgi:hypothetical protein
MRTALINVQNYLPAFKQLHVLKAESLAQDFVSVTINVVLFVPNIDVAISESFLK